MKRDGRTLDHETLEEIRLMAVQRVWEGERPSVVIASTGSLCPVIYRYCEKPGVKGAAWCALRSRKGTEGVTAPSHAQAKSNNFSVGSTQQRPSPGMVSILVCVDAVGAVR